ncbi:hypothetical protein U9M48_005891 [Paspalum notatum var. saurae]|uniref:F-box domain-containing protein n=1 Tax=Paspalum notatum var. saurae TaxID=547442 RepID=A0AAQ3PT66_PASNO
MDIFAFLEIPDLLRAASVCSSWNAAYSVVRSVGHYRRRPQTPCLIYTSESAAGENVTCLYSLAEKRTYILTHLDPLIHKRLGDEKWTWLPARTEVDDCIYKDGLLYAVTLFGEIVTFDLSGTEALQRKKYRNMEEEHEETVVLRSTPWSRAAVFRLRGDRASLASRPRPPRLALLPSPVTCLASHPFPSPGDSHIFPSPIDSKPQGFLQLAPGRLLLSCADTTLLGQRRLLLPFEP